MSFLCARPPADRGNAADNSPGRAAPSQLALAEILVEGARLGLDACTPALLERYERWRRFDSAFSAAVMDGLNRLFSNDNAPLRALRDLGLGLVDRAPQLKRFLVREAAGATGEVPRLLKGERV